MKITVDGNQAAATAAYAFSDMAAIYPITPSSAMSELADEMQSRQIKNLFNETVSVTQFQSEGGAAGAVHGALSAGSLATTFTCSQGLLLMIPNMYKIAGELLPAVFHVSARTLSTHALSIFGDHSDVMACRATGFAMLNSTSVQEAMDMAAIAHITALKSSVPFIHFFDGFRTSHEINKIDNLEQGTLKKLLPMDAVIAFKARGLSSTKPHQQGTAQNPDIFFQNREASNTYYSSVEKHLKNTFEEFANLTGRKYSSVEYFGAPDAIDIIVIMASGYHTAKQTAAELNKLGKKTGVVLIRLYRPFPADSFIKALPKTVKNLSVLDRTKECGAGGEPLYKDICTAMLDGGASAGSACFASKSNFLREINVFGGIYGLGGKEFTPAMVKAVFDNMASKTPKQKFTVGITDDVSHTSLPVEKFNLNSGGTSCKFYGLGSDGTVSANKNSIKIIGENTDLNCQGYFEFDSKKSGSLTISHLRFGKLDIDAPYLIDNADFAACHNINYIGKYDMLNDLKSGGTFLLNSPYSADMLGTILPDNFLTQLKQKKINFYIIDANRIAQENRLGGRINVIMQASFFYLTKIMPYSKVEELLIDAAQKTYKKKGEAILRANTAAIKATTAGLVRVDLSKFTASSKLKQKSNDEYYNSFILPIERKLGDTLPVSQFDPRGRVPTNTSKFEKRGISIESPCWIKQNCIQCNMCSFVCPHAAIRPVLVKNSDIKDAPSTFDTLHAMGVPEHQFRIQINVADCTGCENCVKVCPAKEKALKMTNSVKLNKAEETNYNFSQTLPENPQTIFKSNTLKGSQFIKPLFEFSGACAGCGETPYIKLATQLFGKRMLIANATGCSSIYGGSAPSCPYAQNSMGHGPAWASSLFEDNAEFGLGIYLAKKKDREALKTRVTEFVKTNPEHKATTLLNEWLQSFDDGEKSYELAQKLTPITKDIAEFSLYQNSFTKESTWLIGGDGWAYDIGFGGLDHVLASGENVNILVLDTEVYSNTGGQTSKSTPLSATAKFSMGGKRTPKKDLGLIAMTYNNVYVAQIGMGADMNQTVKAMWEAEQHDGPSIIIAYSPCINHGINMNEAQNEIKKAVECGYWHLYRYNPSLLEQNKNPFTLDSNPPTRDYLEFLEGESRYAALKKIDPKLATELHLLSKESAEQRYKRYLELANKKF
ncbi:MAG: pyruvate:ferredoxin (flavodoxin) oxidoreductase [Christensenellaceae bacterium]|jgi:pyruvate-ferredoxin/flavodoxin oxidoreductase|nr:pyruvate:ferredoxin (flavodoxin) oxidoreductase [Christensenellaceae bacterium]